jgi:hypothetical protein
MEDVSGKFVLVLLRADRVRVHHKKTKHEYRFQVSGDPPEIGACAFHPNPAAQLDPRTFRDEATAAAEWFITNRDEPSAPVLARPSSGWVSV